MGQYLPRYESPTLGITATATITGGQLVNAFGAPTTAGDPAWIGVASNDRKVGDHLTVWYGEVQRLTPAGTITAGQLVKAAANGQVTPYTPGTDSPDVRVGVALTGSAGNPTVDVEMDR